MGFRLIEFEEKGKQTIEHEFQVDGTEYPKGKEPKYDMVIGNELLWNMGMVINFKNETLDWEGDKIPLKGMAVGNGLTNPEIQYSAYPDMALDGGQ